MRELDGRDAEMWRSVAFMWWHLAKKGEEAEPWHRDACVAAHEAAEACGSTGPKALIWAISAAEERRWTRAS